MTIGRKTGGGSRKGIPNKLTTAAKEAFELAFDELGGAEALAVWARSHRGEFYKLYARLIPIDTNHSGALNLNWPLPKTALDQ
jgi:hypothetical protein